MHTNEFKTNEIPESKAEIVGSAHKLKKLKKRFVSSSFKWGLTRFFACPCRTTIAVIGCSCGAACCACSGLSGGCVLVGAGACVYGSSVVAIPFITPSRADHFASVISKEFMKYLDSFSSDWRAQLNLNFKDNLSKQIEKNIYNVINNNTLDGVYVEELVNKDITFIVWDLKQKFIKSMPSKNEFDKSVSAAAAINGSFVKDIYRRDDIKNIKLEDIISKLLSFDFFKKCFEEISSELGAKAAVKTKSKKEYKKLYDSVEKEIADKVKPQCLTEFWSFLRDDDARIRLV